jgi:hypothetical protein
MLRTSTLLWVAVLSVMAVSVVWVLRRPCVDAGALRPAAVGLARTLDTLAGQTGDEASVFLTEDEADLLQALCTAIAPPPPPPCPSCPEIEAVVDDAHTDFDPDVVEECPACPRCKPPVLPVRVAGRGACVVTPGLSRACAHRPSPSPSHSFTRAPK